MNLQLESFAQINQSFRREIELYGDIVHFTKSDSIFDYEETLEYFYIILSGKIKVYQINLKNAKEQTIYLMGRGDMYDAVTLLDGQTHEVVVDVLEGGDTLRIPIGKAREWMYDYPEFGEIVLKFISSQMRKIEELATDLTLFDTQERLIKLIIQNMNSDGEGSMLDGLSHTELAKLIGTVRHVVDRHIKQLKEDGVLKKENKKISLVDEEKLLDKIKSLF